VRTKLRAVSLHSAAVNPLPLMSSPLWTALTPTSHNTWTLPPGLRYSTLVCPCHIRFESGKGDRVQDPTWESSKTSGSGNSWRPFALDRAIALLPAWPTFVTVDAVLPLVLTASRPVARAEGEPSQQIITPRSVSPTGAPSAHPTAAQTCHGDLARCKAERGPAWDWTCTDQHLRRAEGCA
jgi:hypothetical protein